MSYKGDLARQLQAYTFFGAPPPDIPDDALIEYVRQGLSEVSGQKSGKDPIIGGIRLLKERRVLKARETFELAMRDTNQAVRREATEALSLLFPERGAHGHPRKATTNAGFNVCPNPSCRQRLGPGSNFCTRCGTQLRRS